MHQLVAAGYPIHEVNIDRDRTLAARYHVDQIPCFVLIVGGREVTRTVGANSPATLLAMFRQAGFDPANGSAIASSQPPRRFGGRAAAANAPANPPANDPGRRLKPDASPDHRANASCSRSDRNAGTHRERFGRRDSVGPWA